LAESEKRKERKKKCFLYRKRKEDGEKTNNRSVDFTPEASAHL